MFFSERSVEVKGMQVISRTFLMTILHACSPQTLLINSNKGGRALIFKDRKAMPTWHVHSVISNSHPHNIHNKPRVCKSSNSHLLRWPGLDRWSTELRLIWARHALWVVWVRSQISAFPRSQKVAFAEVVSARAQTMKNPSAETTTTSVRPLLWVFHASKTIRLVFRQVQFTDYATWTFQTCYSTIMGETTKTT